LIKILDIHSGFCFLLEGHSDLISRIIRISNEKIASCSFDKTIKIWNMITGECLRTIEAHSNFVRFMIELPNNKIISCSDDKKIKVWDTDTGYCLKTLRGHDRTVRFIEILQ
jgi:WD40 repeat protein